MIHMDMHMDMSKTIVWALLGAADEESEEAPGTPSFLTTNQDSTGDRVHG